MAVYLKVVMCMWVWKWFAVSIKSSLLVSCMLMMQALLAVQLDNGSCVRFVETDVDLAKMVLQYTKAVAERPYKYAVHY